ncbi:MAG TPA: pacearchaeosortase [Candidatus Nanoarchaeia archaeon]|nr:pacearchaeosortase [Candidatus Nanoarchaeia archaeon]
MKYEYKLVLRILLLFVVIPKFLFMIFFIPTIIFPYIILKFIGYNIILDFSSQSLLINDLTLNFISACVATSAYQLLAILILLTKDLSFKRMLKIFIVGSLMILLVNIVRILILSLVFINYGYESFNSLHILLWRGAASFIVFFVWIGLVKIFKIKNIPLISDMSYLLKYIKKKNRK